MTDAIEVALISDDNDQVNSIAVWDIRNGTSLMQYRGGGAVGKHTLSLIGNNFLVTGNNVKPLLSIWPINSSDTIQNIKFVLPARANSLTVSPDGCFLVAGVIENIYIWQIATGKMLAMLSKHYQPVNCIKFSDDGSHFVSGGQDGQVIVWSLSAAIGNIYHNESVEPLHTFSDHALPVTDIYIGSGGMRANLVTVSMDRTCKIYEIGSGNMLLSLVFQEILTAVTLDRVEIGLFVGTSLGNIYHHRLQPPPRTREYHITDENKQNNKFSGHTKAITCLSISLDEQTLMSGSEDCNVITWNIQSRSLLKTLPHKGAITNAIFILTPRVMFDREAKLELITKNFQRMKDNVETHESEVIDVMITPDMENSSYRSSNDNYKSYDNVSIQSSAFISNESQCEKLLSEIERLKKVNKELFEFSAKNIVNPK
ncbi:CLUMA_CG003398, isoform A [Clunio marinus]|uniref:CLUMA_CG003398, isoform A n=1 Tax=Clunio marinus TaxID=568069 RepID=A0A1J1HNN8_9DIPT|nr:CLUMA_CG003398, isoform A [Clunio marinus]